MPTLRSRATGDNETHEGPLITEPGPILLEDGSGPILLEDDTPLFEEN